MDWYTATVFLTVLFAAGDASQRVLCPSTTTLATFNSALIPSFAAGADPEIEERTAILIQQINDSDVDIFCLQEVFFADIQRQIYRALKERYPYILSATDLTLESESPERACEPQELFGVFTCVQTLCAGLPDNEASICLVNCVATLNPPLSQHCRDCILGLSLANQQAECTTLPASRFETNYGLMLLSKRELQNGVTSGFNPQSQFRGYLGASVDGVGDLVCTHLTSPNPTDFYAGPPAVSPFLYSNYDEQQYDEILTLFDVLTSLETPILMGDFNNGPAPPGDNLAWELPFHYGLIAARGFVSPHVLEDGRCTFCADNPTVVGFPNSLILDHIYVTTTSYKGRVRSAERFLDDISTASGTPLSDHFGVKVTLRDVRFPCKWWEMKSYYCPPEKLLLQPLDPPQEQLERLCVAAQQASP